MAPQYVWWTERGAIWLSYYDPSLPEVSQFKSPDDATKDVHIFYYKKADPFKFENQSIDDRSVISGLYLESAVTGSAGSYKVGAAFLDQRSEVPEQFHEYLVDRAIQLGHEKKGTLDVAQYYMSKFEIGVKYGKNFAYSARSGAPSRVSPVEY
jgi:hypothetical protein